MPHTFSTFPTADATRRKKAPRGGEITIRYEAAPQTTGQACCQCGRRPTVRYEGRKFYCRAHEADAFAQAKRNAGRMSVDAILASIRREL